MTFVSSNSTGAPSILAVSTSLKTSHSASRALLEMAVDRLSPVFPSIEFLDLSKRDLPLFAGTDPTVNTMVAPFLESVRGCGGLLLSVPCYWGSVSGVFKNFVDLLSGPAYDLQEPTTVFTGKPVALIVVGADSASAFAGRVDAERILRAAGAEVMNDVVVVTEPRTVPIPVSVPGEVARLAALLARNVLSRSSRGNA